MKADLNLDIVEFNLIIAGPTASSELFANQSVRVMTNKLE